MLDLQFTDEVMAENDCEQTVIRTYTATDLCQNQAMFQQEITFIDDEAPLISNLVDESFTCPEELENASHPIAIDNCSEAVLIFVDETIFNDCTIQVSRTWTATDACGNESSAVQYINIQDTQAPEFLTELSDIELSCGATLPDADEVEATDNCSEVIIEFSEETLPTVCEQNIHLVRTWIATDACGNSAELTQNIRIEDTEAPVFGLLPEDVSIACGEDLPVAEVSATDNCSGEVNIEFEQNYASGGCPNIFRTWTATDACGNQTSYTQTIFIDDTEPPLLDGIIFNLEATCENIPDIPVPNVTDNCDENVDVTVSESLSANGCEQILIRTWIATDDCGNTTIATQSINLIDEAPPVFINPIADNAVECEDLADLALPQVEDNCGGEVDLTYTEEFLGGGCAGQISRVYTATDLCGNSASFTQTINIIDLSPPVFTGVLAGTFVDCGSIPPAISPVITDACNPDDIDVVFSEQQLGFGCEYTIVRRWTATDACGNSSTAQRFIFVEDISAPELIGVPADEVLTCGSTLPAVPVVTAEDNCTAQLEVAYEENTTITECGSVTTRSWSSVDDCGNQITETQTIEITDTEAPVILQIPADVTVNCESVPEMGEVEATDNCTAELTYDAVDEYVYGACPYTILRTYSATDACGNQATAVQTITVEDNEAPELSSYPEDFTTTCSQLDVAPEVDATDNCTAEVEVQFSEFYEGQGCVRLLRRVWEAQDACGNVTSHTQTITLEDTEAPQVMEFSAELTYECNALPTLPEPEFTDDCTELNVTYEEELVAGNCASVYDLLRSWTATDLCGNAVEVSQVIHVVDNSAPVTNLENEEITVTCDELPEIPTLAVFGECGDYEVEYGEEVNYLEELGGTCQLGNAVSTAGEVALWLPNMSGSADEFVFGEEAGMYAELSHGGEIHITGQVYNAGNPQQSWIIDMTLYDPQDWETWSANGGSYKNEQPWLEDAHLEWMYYKLSDESRLIGAGEYEGEELELMHTPVDFRYGFQVGRGANNRNGEYGISGWFAYEGMLNGEFTFGSGDIIADIKCCPDQDITRSWTVEDCAGNSTTVTQVIHVRKELELTGLQLDNTEQPQFDVRGSEGPEFIITFDSGDDAEKTLILTDLSGKTVYQKTFDGLEKNTTYTRRIPKNNMLTGMYMFYLRGKTSSGSDKEVKM